MMPTPVEFAELEGSLRRFVGKVMMVRWEFPDGEVIEGEGRLKAVWFDGRTQERDWTKEEARRSAQRSVDRGAEVPIQTGVQYWVDERGFSSQRIGGAVVFEANLAEET